MFTKNLIRWSMMRYLPEELADRFCELEYRASIVGARLTICRELVNSGVMPKEMHDKAERDLKQLRADLVQLQQDIANEIEHGILTGRYSLLELNFWISVLWLARKLHDGVNLIKCLAK